MSLTVYQGPHIRLFIAATVDTYTICRYDGVVVWHAAFHHSLHHESVESAVSDAARQAIWLAGEARAAFGAKVGTLSLLTSPRPDQPRELIRGAANEGWLMSLGAIPVGNPAELYMNGRWMSWRHTDLTSLITWTRR